MTGRLPSHMLVTALLRRANDSGGFGALLARGEASGGAILVIALKAGGNPCVLERGLGADGRALLHRWQPQDAGDVQETASYWQRRKRNDPDLWVIELDTPSAERFTAETILTD